MFQSDWGTLSLLTKRHVTIKDVARLAGVSTATVSAVLNGVPVVSPKRVHQVREAMIALDYHPDAVARSLRTGKTQVIGVVVPDITNAFFSDVVRGIEDAAAEHYSVIVSNTNEDPLQEQRQLSALLARRADGLLISCSKYTGNYDLVLRRQLPVVFLERLPHGVDAPVVATDNRGGAYAATRHLIELGHERIAVLARSLDLWAHAERVEGYRKAMQEAGLPVHADYFRVDGAGEFDGYEFGMRLLRLKLPPTAVFSCNNKMLGGFLRALGESDVLCPAQMSVVGFDDHIWLRAYRPPITTVSQRSREVGHLAMNMLLSRIAGRSDKGSDDITLPCELIVRSSTARPLA